MPRFNFTWHTLIRKHYKIFTLYTNQRLWLLTFVSVFDQCLIDVLLPGVFQDVEETQVDSVRLFNDDVQQRLSGFDWTISQRLNWLQVSESQRVTLIQVHSRGMCVQGGRQVAVLFAQYVCTSNTYNSIYDTAGWVAGLQFTNWQIY